MECNSCVIRELQYEFKIEGDDNLSLLPMIMNFLDRNHAIHNATGHSLILQEAGVRDFLDFCQDHMVTEQVAFRLRRSDHEDWKPLSEAAAILEMQWMDEIIVNGAVSCHFQPIVNAQEELYAYESLSRFSKQDGSLIYPHEMFAAAKRRGRLYALDRLCRLTAVKQAAPLRQKIFINFIPTSIYSPQHCLNSTVQLAHQLGIDPSLFVFEVVETEQVDDLDHLKNILAYYKEKEFQYALDDVGEGYSTIEMLAELQPHYMKLDMKFAQGVSQDVNKQQIAHSFLDKAIQLQSVPLAEGVERREDFEWLKQRGYQLFQGYLFGKPEPMNAFERPLLPGT